jgi:hypothetical protein
MNVPCVLIADCDSLLFSAFESLSENGQRFMAVRSNASTLAELFSEIIHLSPNFLVMCESQPLSTLESLGSLMMTYPRLRLVIVSPDNNTLKVLSKEDVLIRKPSDLLKLLNLQQM